MTSTLKSQGYRTTLWVYPLVNTDSAAFKESKYFVKSKSGAVLTQHWWEGQASHVDFTNKEAQNWFVSRLEHLKNTTGVDSFKFDAGELNWVNPNFQFSNRSIQQTPGLFSKLYAETCARLGTHQDYNTKSF